MNQIELQKLLQESGTGSRRTIRQWLRDGSIQVNGKAVTDPHFPVTYQEDTVRLEGRVLKLKVQPKAYYILHKPREVVSTLADPQRRPCIADYITGITERVYPVGRLDYHSEGLILLTNDGDLTNFILSAKSHVPKVYLIKIQGNLDDRTKARLERGIVLEGARLSPFQIEYVKSTGKGHTWWRVTIIEGKKHIIRKAFLFCGHPVDKLKREAIGTIRLKSVPAGHWRELLPVEIDTFKKKYKYRSIPD
jgi:23S rRNA pseudouridine2605 synthase